MRKLLQTLGIVFLVVIVSFAGAWEYVVIVGNRLDAESKAYVDEAVPAIGANWSVDEARRRATPAFLSSTSEAEFARIMALFAKLGHLVAYQGATGHASFYYPLMGGRESTTAFYKVQAQFEHGDAVIDCTLRKLDSVWRIEAFRVNSKLFLDRSEGGS